MSIAHGEVLGDWEDKLTQYHFTYRRAESEYMKTRTPDNRQKYHHWKAICNAFTLTLGILRESIVEAILLEGDPISFFRDRLVPQKPTLDSMLLNAGPATQQKFNEQCEQLFNDLETYGGRI
ncbi:hypothetical protein J4219_05325 [Candidatus Woesearchaeota archaeon]|nr:hypothetical protein [Candidatus Woesearchaeota archaeon]